MTIWHFDQKQIPGKRSSELSLSWRLSGDSITDDYTVEDISAGELWSMWRRRYAKEDQQPIYWSIHGDGIAEFAPSTRRGLRISSATTPGRSMTRE